jgi:hypothetical protein
MSRFSTHRVARTLVLVTLAFACVTLTPSASASGTQGQAAPEILKGPTQGAISLESAAAKAGETGRKVAMSLIVLGFAIAAVILVFRRDFKEAAGVFAIGLVAILFATPAGVSVLHDTVNSLFGSS